MNSEQIIELMHAAPFAPFTVYMADGQSFYIDHPDFVAFSRDRAFLVLLGPGSKTHYLALRNMTRRDTVNPAAEAAQS